jgi:membrane-associated phospholipid phosphatase
MVLLTRPRAAVTVPVGLAAAVYAVLWLGYRDGWGWLDSADSSSLRALYDVGIKHPSWVCFWDGVSAAFGPTAFRVMGAVAVMVELVKRRPRAVLFLLASVELSGFVTQAAKNLAHRPRPVTALAHESSSSFPSGHALAVMVGVLALLTVVLPMMSRPIGVVAVAVGALIVVAVGFGRVALNAHYPSDVVAGWALGYLYFVMCLRLCRPSPVSGGR